MGTFLDQLRASGRDFLDHLSIMSFLWGLFCTISELWAPCGDFSWPAENFELHKKDSALWSYNEFQVQQKNCVIHVKALCCHLTSIFEPNFNPEYCDMAFSWKSGTEFCLWFNLAMWFRAWCVQWLVDNKFKRMWKGVNYKTGIGMEGLRETRKLCIWWPIHYLN